MRETKELFTFALDLGTGAAGMDEAQLETVVFNCLDFCWLNGKTAHFFLRGDDPARQPELWYVLDLLREEAVSFTLLSEPEKAAFVQNCPISDPVNRFEIGKDGSVFWSGNPLGSIFGNRLADLWAVSGCSIQEERG